MPPKNKPVKNILVARNDRFGEFLLNIPALRALKETFPEARITVITDPAVEELAAGIPFIDGTIGWQAKPHPLDECRKLARALRKEDFDLALILNPTKELHLISFLAGIPARVGYDRKWGFLLTHRIKDRKHLAEKHEIEYNLELVGLIGAKTENLELSLNVNDDIIEQSRGLIKSSIVNPEELLIAIHPWTSDQLKQWPLDRFLQLAKQLAERPSLKILIIGGKAEELANKGLFESVKSNIIDLTGKTSLLQLAALLKISQLLISGDSGPMHLACAVNTPVLAIFRNDITGKCPVRWGPRGKKCFVIENSSLGNIKTEEVLDKAKEILFG